MISFDISLQFCKYWAGHPAAVFVLKLKIWQCFSQRWNNKIQWKECRFSVEGPVLSFSWMWSNLHVCFWVPFSRNCVGWFSPESIPKGSFCVVAEVSAQEFRGAKGRRPEDHWICRSRNWMGQRFCHISLRRLDCHEGRGWEGSVGIRMGCCSGVHWKRLKPMLELGDRIGWPGWPGCCFASLWSALRLGCWSMD